MFRSWSFFIASILGMLSPVARAACEIVDGSSTCSVQLWEADLVITGGAPYAGYPGIGKDVAVADFDADGATDLLLGSSLSEAAYLVSGPASGVIRVRGNTQLTNSAADALFGTGLSAGDADGDGIADAVVGAPGPALHSAYLFMGPITGSRDIADADAVLVGPRHGDTGRASLIGPDVDGDRQPDVVVAAVTARDDSRPGHQHGAVYVVHGALTGSVNLETAATYIYRGVHPPDRLGHGLASVGDWNGDGVDDLASSALEGVYIVDGGGTAGDFVILDVASARIDVNLGRALAAADYDGDGTSDLFVGAPDAAGGEGTVSAFLGPLSGNVSASIAETTWVGENHFGDNVTGLGFAVAAGDVDGDGASDVLMGDPGGGPGRDGAVYLQLGRVSGNVDVADLVVFPTRSGGIGLGRSVALVPDWTGDGGAEVLMGAPVDGSPAGASPGGSVRVFFSDSLFP